MIKGNIMNVRYYFLTISLLVHAPFAFSDIGKDIEKGFKKAGKGTEKAFEKTGKFVQELFTHKVKVHNDTNGSIAVELKLAGTCAPTKKEIKKGKDHTFDVETCCSEQMKINATSGVAKGKGTKVHQTPRTGYGIGCLSYDVYVVNTANGYLSAHNKV